MPPVEVLVLAPLIIVLAYVIFGISGFGSTLIAVPLLAHVLPLKFVIPMLVVLDCVGSIGMGLRLRADVFKRELKPLLPFLVLGMLAGAYLLLRLPGEMLLGGLGVFVLLYGVLYLTGKQARFRVARWSAVPFGLFAGTTSSMFGVGGPIYVVYLTARGATADQIRATMPVIFIFTTVARIIIFAAAGLYTIGVIYAAGLLLPVMGLGLWIGSRLRLSMSGAQIVRIIGALLFVSGGSLIARALTAG